MNSCFIVCSLWTISLRCTLFLSYRLMHGPPFSSSTTFAPSPLRPSLTKFVLDFVLAEDYLAHSLADAHAGAGAGAGSAPPPPSSPSVVFCSEHPLPCLLLCCSRRCWRNGAKHVRQIVQIRPGQANAS